MTKIKNFKLALRPREIGRLLKNREKLQMTPALEASIEHAAADAKSMLQSASLYTTLPRTTAEKATPLEMPDNVVAVSVIAVTIGPKLEEARAEAVARKDLMHAALLAAVQHEALQQAVQFVVRLIQEQAKEEECEMSSPQPVEEAAQLPPLAALLSIQRIGISLDEQTSLLPPHARLAWTLWTPLVKQRSTKRADPACRQAGSPYRQASLPTGQAGLPLQSEKAAV